MRTEHKRLIDSERKLLHWNTKLHHEVEKRTRELKKINEQSTNTFVSLAHEAKTPLTLMSNYLNDYLNKGPHSEEIYIIKKNIDKLSADIINFFDLERFKKGLVLYDHDVLSDFSDLLSNSLILFSAFAKNRGITIKRQIQEEIWVKCDPVALDRIINNLIENAIKFFKR